MIATFVTIVDTLIQAVSLELHAALGAFISLIVVNCLILGRAEAFASRNGVGRSLLDALGMGLGFSFALLCLGGVRRAAGKRQPVRPAVVRRAVSALGGDAAAGRRILLAGRLAAAVQLARPASQPTRKGGGLMTPTLWSIFIDACLINNFVLAYFLGICPFLGVSGKLPTAVRMGGAVTFVMLISSLAALGMHRLLTALDVAYLSLIAFIAVIASTVQLVEMFIKKTSPALFRALGIFLPLITTNCAILGLALFQTNRGYGLLPGPRLCPGGWARVSRWRWC